MKVIGALLAVLVQGRGGVLVIEGPPGIGKSRLLTEVMALADKSGVRTLFGEAFEYQQTVPFFALFMATLRADPPVGDAEALRQHKCSRWRRGSATTSMTRCAGWAVPPCSAHHCGHRS